MWGSLASTRTHRAVHVLWGSPKSYQVRLRANLLRVGVPIQFPYSDEKAMIEDQEIKFKCSSRFEGQDELAEVLKRFAAPLQWNQDLFGKLTVQRKKQSENADKCALAEPDAELNAMLTPQKKLKVMGAVAPNESVVAPPAPPLTPPGALVLSSPAAPAGVGSQKNLMAAQEIAAVMGKVALKIL